MQGNYYVGLKIKANYGMPMDTEADLVVIIDESDSGAQILLCAHSSVVPIHVRKTLLLFPVQRRCNNYAFSVSLYPSRIGY